MGRRGGGERKLASLKRSGRLWCGTGLNLPRLFPTCAHGPAQLTLRPPVVWQVHLPFFVIGLRDPMGVCAHMRGEPCF